MNRRDLENGIEENREVTELLAALPRVEAPANFDFGVKSRIAAGRSKPRSTMFPFLKVAVPLSLVLLVGAFVLYYTTMPRDGITVANSVGQQDQAPEQLPVAKTAELPVRQDIPSGTLEPQVTPPLESNAIASTRAPKVKAQRRSTNSASTTESGGGSKVFSLTDANLIQAPGTSANKNAEIAVRELLEMLGMKADVVSGKWKVISTSANSLAERSGVLANDIVEAINDQALGGANKIKGTVGKTITIGRGGKSIKLDLKH